MAMNAGDILIVGCGPGGEEYLSPAAREAAASADVLVGSARLLAMFPQAGQTVPWHGAADDMLDKLDALRAAGQRLAVLVSGDPGLFSFAQTIVRRFGRHACRIIPAVSSVQVAFARLALDWTDAALLSAHGRTPATGPTELAGRDKIAVLAGTAEAMAWCGWLAQRLAPTHDAYVCEDLTLPQERVGRVEAAQLAALEAASLTIVLIVRKELLA